MRLTAMQTWPLLTNDAKKIFLRDGFRVDVVEHDRGVVAAELERHALQRSRRAREHLLARRDGARERDLVDAGMRRHRGAELVAAGQDVDDAGGEDLVQELADFQRRERRVRRRFQDDRVARVERRHERPQRQVHGRIPRRDDADDTERPVTQLDVLVVVVGDDLDGNLDADHAVGLRGAAIDLGDGLRERLALLARQELGELVLPLA